jgi:hypothetical protein
MTSYFMLPAVAGMTVHCTMSSFFSVEIGSCKLFCSGCLGTAILPMSVSHVAWDDRHTSLPNYLLMWESHKIFTHTDLEP